MRKISYLIKQTDRNYFSYQSKFNIPVTLQNHFGRKSFKISLKSGNYNECCCLSNRLHKLDKGWSEKESGNPPDKFWEGEIDNKLPNGFGTYQHTNGTIYVGQYVDGLREGQGTWTLYDGSKFVGIWKDNRRWKGKSFDEEGKGIGEYVDGEEELYIFNKQGHRLKS